MHTHAGSRGGDVILNGAGEMPVEARLRNAYMRRMTNIFIATVAIVHVGFTNVSAAEPSYGEVSRCFWVYAPIHELAREIQFQELLVFTQGRVGWMTGFIASNRANQLFKQAFERDLESRKVAGMAMKEVLRKAISLRDNKSYQSIMSRAVDCDKSIGIRTGLIPKIAN